MRLFIYRLADHLGYASPTRMLDEMTMAEFQGWQEYEQVTGPLGHYRMDAWHAQQAAISIAALTGKEESAASYLLFPNPLFDGQSKSKKGYRVDNKEDVEMLKAHLKGLAKMSKKKEGKKETSKRKDAGVNKLGKVDRKSKHSD